MERMEKSSPLLPTMKLELHYSPGTEQVPEIAVLETTRSEPFYIKSVHQI